MNGAHYSMRLRAHEILSVQRRYGAPNGFLHVKSISKKVLAGLGKKGQEHGSYIHERASLMFDQVCQSTGSGKSTFLEDGQLKGSRHLTTECYFCCQERPARTCPFTLQSTYFADRV
jgi:hypothetical protein